MLWFTGLSGSGKSTLAQTVGDRLRHRGFAIKSLDGDVLREGLNSDLGFSEKDRRENVRRLGEVAALFADSGFVVLTAAISPFRQGRREARECIGDHRYVEIWANADLDVCEARDPKGIYARARAGEIADMTGIASPYEPPEQCELTLQTGVDSVETCVDAIESWLIREGLLAADLGSSPREGSGS